MAGAFRRHLTTIVVAAVTAAVMAAGPPLVVAAVEAINADKVDGKDAVGAGASIANRAGKLVATNSAGRLPGNIIVKAPDANRLDGLDSAAFLRKTGTAVNAQKLDGKDSTAFLPSTGDIVVTEPGPWLSDNLQADMRITDLSTAVQRTAGGMTTAGTAYLPVTGLISVLGETVASVKSVQVCISVFSLTIDDIRITTRAHTTSVLANARTLADDPTDRTAGGCFVLQPAPGPENALLPTDVLVVSVTVKDINADGDAILLGRTTLTYGIP